MKYIGSKARIAKHIVPIIQEYIDKSDKKIYIEPFVGGANVIDKINAQFKIGNDFDKIVIDLYTATVKDPKLLDTLPDFISKDLYYDVRDSAGKYENWYRSAILLFASYNARVYGGCYGAYAKTKDGNIRNYYQEALRNYKKQIPNLKDVIFTNFDYRDIKDLEVGGTVIYCDPPYAEGIEYKSKFNHEQFWQWVRENSKNNIILVSEYNAPNDFECIWSMPVKTHLNNRNKLNKVEKLFIYNKNKKED